MLVSQLRETKVEDFAVAAAGDENIGGLDVAVNDPFGVCGIQSVCDFYSQIQQLFEGQRLAFDATLECPPIQVFHGDEGLTVLLAKVVDRANIRMIECGSSLRLTPEAFERPLLVCHLQRQEFQGDHPVQASVFSLVHDTHATSTQLLEHAVVQDGLANHGWKCDLGEAC